MYNSKIDLYVNQALDGFFEYIKEREDVNKLPKGKDFVEGISVIDQTLLDFSNGLEEQIGDIVTRVDVFLEFSIRYLTYYLLLYIGAYYVFTLEDYVSSVIGLMMNKTQFKVVINDFFNPSNNSRIFG